jgi:formate-dependent nitrite reductase membrane component NrfD
MILQYFAHAGEDHATATEATNHMLQEWYIALPLFLLALVGVAAITYMLTKKSKPVTYLVITGILLISGIFAYTIAPIISIVSLAVGMAMTLVLVLFSLMPKNKK